MVSKEINPGHRSVQRVLLTIGPILLALGLLLIVIGMASFFLAFGGDGPPRYFWCAFLGMPLLFVGSAMCMFGLIGKLARYQAQEIAPVAKDTFNYMAEGTADGVRAVAGALGQGLREGGFEGGSGMVVRCHKCKAPVAADAKFCGRCGQAVGQTKPCPQCGERNDPDARFCDHCGCEYV